MNIQVGYWKVPQFTLGDRLAKARSMAGISQQKMSEDLTCSRRSIVRYETGARVPRSVILGYHAVTQVDLGWLEHGVPSPEKLPELESNQQPIVMRARSVPRSKRDAA